MFAPTVKIIPAIDEQTLAKAERELITAFSCGPESNPDVRKADWAAYWGPRLITAIRGAKHE